MRCPPSSTTPNGRWRAAAIAAAPSAATDFASGKVLTQRENGLAAISMPVIGRTVADDVDHRRRCLVGIVDVGESARVSCSKCALEDVSPR
jgi:hypothetical protein